MDFGTLDQALAAARRLHRRHAAIGWRHAESGWTLCRRLALPGQRGFRASLGPRHSHRDGAGRPRSPPSLAFDRGSGALLCRKPRFAALFGIPQANLPSNWQDFAAYNNAMWESETLTVIPEARAIAEQVLSGTNLCLRIPKWYRAVTAGMLPPRLRIAFGLDYGQAEQHVAKSMIKWIRRAYPLLPDRLRHVGPYQEAMARLSGRMRPDLLNQLANQLWIGQRTLDDGRGENASKGL